jgi:hypothetical protein
VLKQKVITEDGLLLLCPNNCFLATFLNMSVRQNKDSTTRNSASSLLSAFQHAQQQEFIIKGYPYESLSSCAEAFYKQFSFRDHGSASDSFRASLRAIQKEHAWAAELLKNIDVRTLSASQLSTKCESTMLSKYLLRPFH